MCRNRDEKYPNDKLSHDFGTILAYSNVTTLGGHDPKSGSLEWSDYEDLLPTTMTEYKISSRRILSMFEIVLTILPFFLKLHTVRD